MALYLSAEQKNLKSLFSNDNRYIIPSYQRHYSWTMEQCKQMYDDILDAFESNTDSYFLGNIVLAEGDDDDRPEVVDGQQRLVTLWLFLKALYILMPANTRLRRMIEVESYDDASSDFVSAIYSEVFEVKDQEQIDTMLLNRLEDFEKVYGIHSLRNNSDEFKSSPLQLESNGFAIYALLKDYFARIEDDRKRNFIDYFISKVYLLPIVLKDDDLDIARSNALMVFETINNRGMDLQNADIFKARLYHMSLTVGKGNEFIEQWKSIISRCNELDIKIDDLFRYYYHILRGQESIVIAEKRLRDFFQKDSKSPFKQGNYELVLDALQNTLDAIEIYIDKRTECSRLGAWLQVLDAYTNQNPVYAYIVFLYFHKSPSDEEQVAFLKKIIRYCYFKGSTMSVKFEIYNIIYKVASGQIVDDYLVNKVDDWMWNYPGRLRKGLTLLAFYLKYPSLPAVQNYRVDKIIKAKDQLRLPSDWGVSKDHEVFDSLGNSIVLDMPQRSTPVYIRYQSYSNSSLEEVRNLKVDSDGFSFAQYNARMKQISSVLINFFVKGIG